MVSMRVGMVITTVSAIIMMRVIVVVCRGRGGTKGDRTVERAQRRNQGTAFHPH